MFLFRSSFDGAPTSPLNAPTAALPSLEIAISISKGDSQLRRWSSLIGIVTAIVGNILISFALNIQRYAHIRLHEERFQRREKARFAAKNSQNGYGTTIINGNHAATEHNQVETGENDPLRHSFHSTDSQSTGCSDKDHKQGSTYLGSPYWWGGIILMTIGEVGNFLAYGFAPASIVSPLGVVALISNCVIAPIMLNEQFRLRDFWGVVVAVGGAFTVVLSAQQQEKKLGPHEILGAITTTEFKVYVAVTVFLIGVLLWASPRHGNKTILIDLGLVGLFGGYTALSTKGVASMLSSTLWRALTTPVTYALLAILIGTAVMQVKYVNKALQRFDSTQVIPVQFVMFTLSVIIGSAILYRDFEKATVDSVGKFVGGCLLTFFGVFLITSDRLRHGGDDDEEEESDEEGEERISLAQQEPTLEEGQYQIGTLEYAALRRRSKAGLAQNGDSTNDDDPNSDSRRIPVVISADPLSRPRSYSSSSYSQLPHVVTFAPTSELPLGTEDTPLLSNPWRTSTDDLQGKLDTNSLPLLPSEPQSATTSSLKPTARRPSTLDNSKANPTLPQASLLSQSDRPITPARHSISRMMPGPLLSPLSGGLSVVVADSLRRGVDSRSRYLRRPRLSLKRTKSGTQRLVNPNEISAEGLSSSPLKNGDNSQALSKSLGTDPPDRSHLTRSRSLSNTLGDLFRGKRQKVERRDSARDEEAGPSGS